MKDGVYEMAGTPGEISSLNEAASGPLLIISALQKIGACFPATAPLCWPAPNHSPPSFWHLVVM